LVTRNCSESFGNRLERRQMGEKRNVSPVLLEFMNPLEGGFARILFRFSCLPNMLSESGLPAKRFHEVILFIS
jgi:hypothetical protein